MIFDAIPIAVVLAALMWARNRLRRWWNLAALESRYEVMNKYTSQRDPGSLTITWEGNVLNVKSTDPAENGVITGRVVMDEPLLVTGRGAYEHLTVNGDPVWGHWDVHKIDNKTLLVHVTYALPQEIAAFQGRRWTQIDGPRSRSLAVRLRRRLASTR